MYTMMSVSGVEETAVHNDEREWSSSAKFLISLLPIPRWNTC